MRCRLDHHDYHRDGCSLAPIYNIPAAGIVHPTVAFLLHPHVCLFGYFDCIKASRTCSKSSSSVPLSFSPSSSSCCSSPPAVARFIKSSCRRNLATKIAAKGLSCPQHIACVRMQVNKHVTCIKARRRRRRSLRAALLCAPGRRELVKVGCLAVRLHRALLASTRAKALR